MRTVFFFLTFISFCQSIEAQIEPSIFEPGIISDDGVFGFTLSPDGKEAFWVKSNGGRDTLIIMTSVKARGKWQKPTPAFFSGKPGVWKDIDPVFSPDGTTLLFQSDRPVQGKPERKLFDIWAIKKTSSGWGEPYHLGNEINTDVAESYASVAVSGNLYFMKQNPDGIGNSDIYVSKLSNGKYLSPENVGAPINTPFRESNPFISPDEDYMIYFSSDSTGFGEVDLMITFNGKEGWSQPQNLGTPINSEMGEFCPFVHDNQKRLYFSRTIQKGNGRRTENIYSINFDVNNFRK
jgi:hypothetical protein